MAIFRYKARNKKGKVKTGVDIGMGENDLVTRYRRRELEIFFLASADKDLETKIKLLLERSNTKDLVIFSRQFSVMISANVPVVESLLILIEQTENFSLKKMIADIAFEVDDLDFELSRFDFNIITEPNSPGNEVRVAMIEHNGAIIELIEFGNRKKE